MHFTASGLSHFISKFTDLFYIFVSTTSVVARYVSMKIHSYHLTRKRLLYVFSKEVIDTDK